MTLNPPTHEDVANALRHISADCARDEWVKVLMGIKAGLGDDGENLARMWSETGSEFDERSFAATWKSIKGGGVGIGTVFALAKRGGYEWPRKAADLPVTAQTNGKAALDTAKAEKPAEKGVLERQHYYTNPVTRNVDLIVRVYRLSNGKKDVVQSHYEGGKEVFKAPPLPLPLYNRSRLAEAQTVFVVEGEKKVEVLHEIGITATTSPGGCGAAKKADWSPLAGKTVCIWPDHDAPKANGDNPGLKYAADVADILTRLNPPAIVWQIDPATTGLPQTGTDAVDFLRTISGKSKEFQIDAVWNLVETAQRVGGSKLESRLERMISGEVRLYHLPWERLNSKSQALLPGTLTILCGSPGASKSLMLLEILVSLFKSGVASCVYELEENTEYHEHRILAQLEGNSQLTQSDWVHANPDATRAAYRKNRQLLDKFSPSIWAAGDDLVSQGAAIEWIEARCNDGFKVIAVDPVTALHRPKGVSPPDADMEFVLAAKNLARRKNVALIFVTHPPKGKVDSNSLDDIAGGAAYQRFPQTVLWLKLLPEPEIVDVGSSFGVRETEINRNLILAKCRNGSGTGVNLGYTFCADSLRMREEGTIIPKKKKGGRR